MVSDIAVCLCYLCFTFVDIFKCVVNFSFVLFRVLIIRKFKPIGLTFRSTNKKSVWRNCKKKRKLTFDHFRQNLISSPLVWNQLLLNCYWLLHSVVFLIALLYGCQAWTIKKQMHRGLTHFWDVVSPPYSASFMDRLFPRSASYRRERFIMRKPAILAYFGHVARGNAGELGTTILEGKEIKRPSQSNLAWQHQGLDRTWFTRRRSTCQKDRQSWSYSAKLAATHTLMALREWIISTLQIYRHYILRRASRAFHQYFYTSTAKCVSFNFGLTSARRNGAGIGCQNFNFNTQLVSPHHWRWIDASGN